MKITLISLHFAEYSFSLARALAELNHDVLLILGYDNANNEFSEDTPKTNGNLKVEYIMHKQLKNPTCFYNTYKLLKLINDFSADIVHLQETYQDYLLLTIALLKFKKNRLVLTVHDHKPHSGKDSNLGRKAFYRDWLRNKADHIIVHGQEIKNELSKIRPTFNISSVMHGALGCDSDVADPGWIDGYLLFFGRIEAYKGLGIFIESVKQLNLEGFNVKGVIAGRGSELEQYRSDIENNQQFILKESYIDRKDLPALFYSANIVVLPYLDGTQSGVAAIAARYGRTVIATNVGSIPEMVKDDETGLIIDANSVDSLNEAIKRALENPCFLKTLSRNATKASETWLSWKSIAKDTFDVYSSFKKY